MLEYLQRGELVALLEAFPPRPSPVSLACPRTRLPSRRLRVFIDWASEVFGRLLV